MGVYSRPITEDKIISFEEFAEYFYESDYQMRMMFEKEDLVYSIQEANESDVQLPSIVRNVEFTAGEPEKVKKTLIEWIKEIFDKFIKAVKDLFEKLQKTIYDFYMRTNFIDDIVSKFKDKVTYQNLTTARDKGWKGLSIEKQQAVINREIDTYVSTLFHDKQKDDFVNEKDFESIIRATDLNVAKEEYSKVEEKIKEFTERGKTHEYVFDFNLNMKYDSRIDTYTGFFGVHTDKEQKYYFPATKQFALTKEFAESGQSKIKKIKEHYKDLTKELTDKKSFFLNNMNLFKKKDSANYTNDKETNQINILYYKAQYKFSSAYVMRTKKIINNVVAMLKHQHSIAIRTYTVMAMAVQKYANA